MQVAECAMLAAGERKRKGSVMKSMSVMKWFGVIGAGVTALTALPGPASADLFQCSSRDGSVRVYDAERNACGRLTTNNPNWTQIGNPPWNDRIDSFGNDDWTRGRDMCLYRDINYAPVSSAVRLPPGYAVDWPNAVSSNRWRTGGC
jgi:hypothetical protein